MTKTEINEIVTGLIERACSRNLDDILSELEIRLYRVDSTRPILQGDYAMYIQSDRADRIYLSRDCPEEEKPFILAHEIGHAVLHSDSVRKYGIPKRGDKEEEEADYFALRLLGTDWDVTEVEGYSSEEIAKMFGVSERSVRYGI